jgi:hypothetical protein
MWLGKGFDCVKPLKTLSWKGTVPLKISPEASWASIAAAGATKNVNKPKLIFKENSDE